MTGGIAEPPLRRSPLHALHVANEGRMVPFAGYELPVQYRLGVLGEHLHTRKQAGLFDVSHMGQVELRPKSGVLAEAAAALERLVPADILGLPVGRQRYAVFTTEGGGILDDLMIANLGDRLFLVVNAARKATDVAHMRAHLDDVCDVVEQPDRALLALQGPAAAGVLGALAPEAAGMAFMDFRETQVAGVNCTVSRSGYTGEDGFEIGMPADEAQTVAEALLRAGEVALIGLGARDSLRLEAGLCLYGADLTETTTPVEAALEWSIQKSRRPGGSRSGGFPGAARIGDELQNGPTRRRVGLQPQGKAILRGGVQVFLSPTTSEPIGHVTSGGYGPSLGKPVAMGYVDWTQAESGTVLFAELRGARLPVTVTALPFINKTYKR